MAMFLDAFPHLSCWHYIPDGPESSKPRQGRFVAGAKLREAPLIVCSHQNAHMLRLANSRTTRTFTLRHHRLQRGNIFDM